MESFHDLAFQRQSDRSFDPDKTVDRAVVCRILESAWMAPSACNAQPWHFIVVDDPELKNKVAASIVAISSIHLLRIFMDIQSIANDKLLWYVVLHLTFVLSAFVMCCIDIITKKSH